LFIQQEYLL